MKRLVILAGLAVAGCSLIPAPPPLIPTGLKCPQVPKWQPSFKAKLSAEVEKLAQDSAITEAIAELIEVREWVAANCKGN
jgi:hypothetical protein